MWEWEEGWLEGRLKWKKRDMRRRIRIRKKSEIWLKEKRVSQECTKRRVRLEKKLRSWEKILSRSQSDFSNRLDLDPDSNPSPYKFCTNFF
jgi:hypothetical protein